MLVTSQNVNGLFTAFDTRFSQAYAGFKTKPWYSTMCMTMPSKTAQNVYAWLARVPKMRQWVGARVVQNLTTRNYTIVNQKYELTLGIPRTSIEDDQYDVYGTFVDQAAFEAAKWPDTVVTPVLQAGATTTSFDGANFFDTNHPVDLYDSSKGIQSNYYSSGKGLTFDNYSTVRANMRSLNGEDGNPLGVEPDTIFVPPQLEAIAKTIVESKLMAPSTVNGNAMVGGQDNPYAGTAKVVVIPELANQPTRWYLADCSRPVKPLIWQLRQAPETVYRNQLTDEHVFTADEFLYGIRSRGGAGYGLWFLMASAQS